MLKDFSETLDKRGHPVPKDGSVAHVARWQIPHSTWRSAYSSQDQRDHSWVDVISYQMDAGKIFYAFTVERRLDLPDDEVLVLPPASPAEQLCIWMEGKAGTSHRILRWDQLDTQLVEKHLGRNTKKYLGRDPLPNRFAFRDPNAVTKNALYKFQSMSLASGADGSSTPGSSSQTQVVPVGSEAPADYFAGDTTVTTSPPAGTSHAIYEASYASPLHSPRSEQPVVGHAPEDAVVDSNQASTETTTIEAPQQEQAATDTQTGAEARGHD